MRRHIAGAVLVALIALPSVAWPTPTLVDCDPDQAEAVLDATSYAQNLSLIALRYMDEYAEKNRRLSVCLPIHLNQ